MRENDVHKMPYSVECDGRTGLVIVPGRPPKCFRCEQIGHNRSECPNDIVAVGRRPRRSFAGVVAGNWRGLPSHGPPGTELTGGDEARGLDPRQGKLMDLPERLW